MSHPDLITEAADVGKVAGAVRSAGLLAFDVEFLSADRYIPELCLVQVAWPGGGPVAIDPLETDVEPIVQLIGDPDIMTVAHSAKQDLQLLFEKFEIRAARLFDTQIAAAFCGIGEQVGLARLVEEMCRVELDKGSQFTDWSRRPLSERQLRYALDDVRYLVDISGKLLTRLQELKRLSWVEAESNGLAAECASPLAPEQMYLKVSGRGSLRGKALGSLVALAAWRERSARAENKPPSWLISDSAMVEACKRGVREGGALRKIRGIGKGTVKEYGDAIAAAIAEGRRLKAEVEPRKAQLETSDQVAVAILNAVVQARSRRMQLASRFVGTKSDVEDLVRWVRGGRRAGERGECRLLEGWRAEMAGDDLLAWFDGERAVVHEAESGAELVER